LFELGPVYLPRTGERLPDEPRRLALLLCGQRDVAHWGVPGSESAALDFFDLKGVIEALLAGLHVAAAEYRPAKAACLHPGRSAEVVLGGEVIGVFGNLHPRTAAAKGIDLGGREVIVGELDLSAMLARVPGRYAVAHPARFPAALRDVAVIVGEDVPAERVAAEVRQAGGDLLREARLFDVYRGPSIPEGTKSLAYALAYQADDRTLKDAEIDATHQAIERRLQETLGARIRGKDGA
jgi:phenylalanyl-tRNA synthetase beta chain